MFKKTTSNKSESSVWKEIGSEFSRYTVHLRKCVMSKLGTYPKQVFMFMVLCILISICCFFMLPRQKEVKMVKNPKLSAPIADGMGNIFGSISDLKEVLELQAVLEGLSKKDNLDKQDSMILIQIKDRLLSLGNYNAKDSIAKD
ncbi:Uncharacterised protein [Sphingobacterium multivorum]|uniref:Uncharacterized protein n=2 Tax=Sphingobacteriaceae TaxID=84566 RepID=A0A2X2JE31_SPHMU|nr:Uncharacterised protein [Sphingobacterium multivorum]